MEASGCRLLPGGPAKLKAEEEAGMSVIREIGWRLPPNLQEPRRPRTSIRSASFPLCLEKEDRRNMSSFIGNFMSAASSRPPFTKDDGREFARAGPTPRWSF